MRGEFKSMNLPSTRLEFENRAMLYQFLNDLEQLLVIKYEFMKNMSLQNISGKLARLLSPLKLYSNRFCGDLSFDD